MSRRHDRENSEEVYNGSYRQVHHEEQSSQVEHPAIYEVIDGNQY
jgi:hypothetical protein